MKLKTILLLSTLLTSSAYAELIKGTLQIKDGASILTTKDGEELTVVPTNKTLATRIHSHARGSNYILEFKGERNGNSFEVDSTPVIYGDYIKISGRLEGVLGVNLTLDGIPVRYGRTKPIYHIPFDGISKQHYIGKDVTVQGHYEEDSFVINSILDDNLLSAGHTALTPENQGHPDFLENPYDYILKEMPKNSNSQSKRPFRGVVHNDKNYKVTPGESVLIMTLSGRQGDVISSAGGHYAFGLGEVQDDEKLSIKGELFNFYFEGEKEVLAGNTDLNNYFGHLIQGQQNYRPTYTVLFYGVDMDKLLKAKREMEIELERVRTEKGLEITQYYNCVVSSVGALRKIGINGDHLSWYKGLFNTKKLVTKNPAFQEEGTVTDLTYLAVTDMEEYVPRNAIESFLKRFKSKRARKKAGVKRIDYIFIPQTPSARAVGGISYNDLKEGYKVIKNKDKKLDQKAIDKILYSIR